MNRSAARELYEIALSELEHLEQEKQIAHEEWIDESIENWTAKLNRAKAALGHEQTEVK